MTDPIRNQRPAPIGNESITFADENVRPVAHAHTHGAHAVRDEFVSDTASLPTRARDVLTRHGQTRVSYTSGFDGDTQRARRNAMSEHVMGATLPDDPRALVGPRPVSLHDTIERQHSEAGDAAATAVFLGGSDVVGTAFHAEAVSEGISRIATTGPATDTVDLVVDLGSIAAGHLLEGAGTAISGGYANVRSSANNLRDGHERNVVAGNESEWTRRNDEAQVTVRRGRLDAEIDFRRFDRGETETVDLGRMTQDFGYGNRMRELFNEATRREFNEASSPGTAPSE